MTPDTIQQFYNKLPYPPPVNNLDSYRDLWADESRRQAQHFLLTPYKAFADPETILIAGCGTSQAARYALRHPKSQVIGIDISETSIKETEKLKTAYALDNLSVNRLSIEDVSQLEVQFDKIVCTGVLHHLVDPQAGLSALQQVLKVDGVLNLMVYAHYGRIGVEMMQAYSSLVGVSTDDDDILALAHTIMAMPPDHPMAPLLANSPDFRRKSALADALLNPREQSYTVPQLLDLISNVGLVFGRWIRQAPYLPYCGEISRTPHYVRLAQLSAQEQYTAMELFRGTILRHNVVMYRNDNPYMNAQEPFVDNRWLSAIPHRLPDTIFVADDRFGGAVGVLINQNHTEKDIVLPVAQMEQDVYEAIDGKSTVQQLINPQGLNNKDNLIRFFEKLRRHDQIVFELTPES